MLPKLLPAVRALLIANVAMFLLQWAIGASALAPLELWPIGSGEIVGGGFRPWQLLSSGFLHRDFLSLLFNLLALWMFGSPLEQTWGQRRFSIYYLGCLLGGNILQLAFSSVILAKYGQVLPTLGSSGATFALLLAYAMLFPHQRVMVFPIPAEIRARTLVMIFGAVQVLYLLVGWTPAASAIAYVGSLLTGWLLIRYWRGQPPFGPRKPKRPRMHIVN